MEKKIINLKNDKNPMNNLNNKINGAAPAPQGATKSYDKVKDSGARQEFATGSRRDTSEGKGRYDLLPTMAIARLAKHFENGARKYSENNWKLGQPLSRYMDSALRHSFKFLEGHRDEDHAIAAAWNLLCMVETQIMIEKGLLPKELDNLPAEIKE